MIKYPKVGRKQKMFCSSIFKYSIIDKENILIRGLKQRIILNLDVWLLSRSVQLKAFFLGIIMEYKTNRLTLRTLETKDVELLYDYYKRNMNFLKPWEPCRSEEYYRRESLWRMITAEALEHRNRSVLRLYLFLSEKKIIGFTGLR